MWGLLRFSDIQFLTFFYFFLFERNAAATRKRLTTRCFMMNVYCVSKPIWNPVEIISKWFFSKPSFLNWANNSQENYYSKFFYFSKEMFAGFFFPEPGTIEKFNFHLLIIFRKLLKTKVEKSPFCFANDRHVVKNIFLEKIFM